MFKVGDHVELARYIEWGDDAYTAYRGVIGSVIKVDEAESVLVNWDVPKDFALSRLLEYRGPHTWWYHPSEIRPVEALDAWVRQVRKEHRL